ncbi:unnamed protein product, partial [Polarella glacialis]
VLVNRRKSGELFLNLLDLRGLTVARNHLSGEELWFLVGIQADVTHLLETAGGEFDGTILEKTQQVTNQVRAKLADDLGALALSGALQGVQQSKPFEESEDSQEGARGWRPLAKPVWRSLHTSLEAVRSPQGRVTEPIAVPTECKDGNSSRIWTA